MQSQESIVTVEPEGRGSTQGVSAPRFYLLVFSGGDATTVALPSSGEVTLGRGAEADLRLKDPAISRLHAKLIVNGPELRLVDLDSRNGTFVHAQPIHNEHLLTPGDAITLGDTVVVVRQTSLRASAEPTLSFAAWHQRLEDELARCRAYGQPLCLAAFTPLANGITTTAALGEALARLGDVCQADDCLWLLLSAANPATLNHPEEHLRRLLDTHDTTLRAGVVCSAHGDDEAATLLTRARAAALAATPGTVHRGADSHPELVVGTRTIIVADATMLRLYELLRRLSESDLPVLLDGETGTGKEHAAFALHHWSRRKDAAFVTINCAALQETLIEGELFGYQKGAFSGAVSTKPGLLETANGGSLLLDEVGDLSAAAQAKLLRAIECQRITRLGDVCERPINVRVIAATHRDLPSEVRAGRFRQDLFFRLSAARLTLPPLRERPVEIPILARAFLQQAAKKMGRTPPTLSPGALQALSQHPWPGNIRQLKNVIDFAAAVVSDRELKVHHLALDQGQMPDVPKTDGAEPASTGTRCDLDVAATSHRDTPRPALADELRELERTRIIDALQATAGHQARAAELIRMPLRTFKLKLKQLGLNARPRPKPVD